MKIEIKFKLFWQLFQGLKLIFQNFDFYALSFLSNAQNPA
jgi:hypothetical protein